MPKSLLWIFICLPALFVPVSYSISAEPKWGTLKGQVVLEGDIPKLQPLVVRAAGALGGAFAAPQNLPDEKLVVDRKSKGIANVVIYLPKKSALINPQLINGGLKRVDVKGFQFVPHVMIVRTDQQVRVLSNDPVAYNVHTNPLKNNPENFLLTPDNNGVGILLKAFLLSQRTPTKVTNDIHPWMSAYWMILDHPYAAVTNECGKFEIADLPVGMHEFTIWHKSSGYLIKKNLIAIAEGVNEKEPLKFTADQILK